MFDSLMILIVFKNNLEFENNTNYYENYIFIVIKELIYICCEDSLVICF